MSHFFDTDTNQKGYVYYIVPKTTTLYRGDTNIYLAEGDVPDVPTFFGLKRKNVAKYGMVFTFKTLKPLKLLALDKPNQKFYDDAPSHIQTILNNQYGFKSGLRDTVRAKDYELVEYLCSQGFDGYLIDEMSVPDDVYVDEYDSDGETEDIGNPRKFHSEMVICNVKKNVKLENMTQDVNKYTSDDINREVMKKRAILHKYEMEEKRKNSKRRPRRDSSPNRQEVHVAPMFTGFSGIGNSPPRTPRGNRTADSSDTNISSPNSSMSSGVSTPSRGAPQALFRSPSASTFGSDSLSGSDTPPYKNKTPPGSLFDRMDSDPDSPSKRVKIAQPNFNMGGTRRKARRRNRKTRRVQKSRQRRRNRKRGAGRKSKRTVSGKNIKPVHKRNSRRRKQ